jgi:hypothetical protein
MLWTHAKGTHNQGTLGSVASATVEPLGGTSLMYVSLVVRGILVRHKGPGSRGRSPGIPVGIQWTKVLYKTRLPPTR